jgi:putative phage-type endonuclease
MTSSRRTWATPGAVPVLPVTAPRTEWLRARAQGIGGSDSAAVAGFNRYSSPRKVYLDKMGLLPPEPENRFMQWGTWLEPSIAHGFTQLTGIPTRRCGLLRSRTHEFMQVSVDRLTADGGGLEIKNAGHYLAEEWGDDSDPLLPHGAGIQAMHALMVTGRSHWWVIGLIGGNFPAIRRVERDEDAIAALVELEHRFWHGHVLPQVPPPVTDSIADEMLLKAFYKANDGEIRVVDREILDPLLVDLANAEAEVAAAEARERGITNQLRDLAGTATGLTYPGNDGKLPNPVVTLKANGTFNGTNFTKDNPDVAERFTRDVTVPKLDVKALAAADEDLYTAYRARILRVTAHGKHVVDCHRKGLNPATTVPAKHAAKTKKVS